MADRPFRSLLGCHECRVSSLLPFFRSTLGSVRAPSRRSLSISPRTVTLVTLLMSKKGGPRADSSHPTSSLLTSFSWPVLPPGVDRPAQRHFSATLLSRFWASKTANSKKRMPRIGWMNETKKDRRLGWEGKREKEDKRALLATFLACTVSWIAKGTPFSGYSRSRLVFSFRSSS